MLQRIVIRIVCGVAIGWILSHVLRWT